MPRRKDDMVDGIKQSEQGGRLYTTIPEHLEKSLRRYADLGIPTGGFLRACLENNLMTAVGAAANSEVRFALQEICQYIYNEIPSPCWGSPEKVQAWLDLDWSEARGRSMFPSDDSTTPQG